MEQYGTRRHVVSFEQPGLKQRDKFPNIPVTGWPRADEKTVCMKTTRALCTAVSWTHKLDSENKQEHDFNNLLLEFRYAIERQDAMFAEYCERELGRMYRARRSRKAQP